MFLNFSGSISTPLDPARKPTVTPSDYTHAKPVHSGEYQLWTFCLIDAIHQAAIATGEARKDARYWLLREVGDWVGSFHWVCKTIEIDPEMLRERLKKLNWKRLKHHQCLIARWAKQV